MAVDFYPVTSGFVAEVGDVDWSRPLDQGDLAAIKQAFWTYSVLIFPDQRLSVGQQLAFARHFGPLEETIAPLEFPHRFLSTIIVAPIAVLEKV